MTYEQLIVAQRSTVDKIVRNLARRHYLAPAELEEFQAAVSRALERNDYELLKGFDGRSTWETYLDFVVTKEFFLFQGMLWGQWRPTRLAQSLGPAAMLLEELVIRDGVLISDAVEIMRTMHRVDVPRFRLLELADQLRLSDGRRPPAAQVQPRPSGEIPNGKFESALRAAVALLSPDDRLILELRIRDRQPLSTIALILKIDMRPLQRRIDQSLESIRRSLLMQGISSEHVGSLLQDAADETVKAQERWWRAVLSPPSE